MSSKQCQVCRAPAAVMPCVRCGGGGAEGERAEGQIGQSRVSQSLLLEGKYQLQNELGRGGMGTVFRAHDVLLDREVAVKFILPEIQSDQSIVQRFRHEARAMASITHENVMRIYSLGRYGAVDFMVNEYIEGVTAQELIEVAQGQGEQLPLSKSLEILVQAAAGLEAVHRGGVVHRDFKPGNIMVESETGRVVLMDFGLGQWRSGQNQGGPDGGGTPAYMAPESIIAQPVAPEHRHLVDIYAFGVTAYEMLTGHLPFEGQNWLEMLEKHLLEKPEPLTTVRPGLPVGLNDIVLKCLAKHPAERFLSAGLIRDALLPYWLRGRKKLERTGADEVEVGECTAEHERLVLLVAGPGPAYRGAVFRKVRRLIPQCEVRSAETISLAVDQAFKAERAILVAPLRDPEMNGFELAALVRPLIEQHRLQLVFTAEELSETERVLLEQLGVARVVGDVPRLAGLERALCWASARLGPSWITPA